MNIKLLNLFFLLLITVSATAQQQIFKPALVQKAIFFDVSPPLRDMVQKSDAITDQSWKELIIKNKQNVISNDHSVADNQFIDPVRQTSFGDAMTSDTTIQNFDGIVMNGGLPPDTDGDVSPVNYFQVVNTKYAIYDKNGNKILGPTNNSVIFNGLPNNSNDGDAVVLYDENADRWLFSQFSLPNGNTGPFYENVAISQTNDPTGTWYRYQFMFVDMPDYPKLAVWSDGYYMTIRRFSHVSPYYFISPSAIAMNRAKMLAGDPTAEMVMFNMPSSAEGTQAADCDTQFPPAGTPCPVGYLTTSSVKLYDFHVDWATLGNSTFLQNYTIPISMFSALNGNSVPQQGTTAKLDAMSGKRIMFRMPYRVFSTYSSMLLNTTVNASGSAGIRWMELRNVGGTWSLYQEGTYAPADGKWRWMGSIAMDANGSIALGFSISSASMFPSIHYTGRLSGDPLGTMTVSEKSMFNGGGCQTDASGRWGDYSAMVVDPSIPGKFWYTQEYYAATSSASWKTRIGSFTFTNLFSTVTTAFPNPVCSGDSTQLNVAPNGGSGNYTYSWSSIPAGFTSTLQNPKAAPLIATKYIATTNDGTLTRKDTVQVAISYKPVVSAGADTTVCWYVTSIPVSGSASNYKQFGWSTSGSGTFTNSTLFETTYLPSLDDKLSGSVDLKLVATSKAPCTGSVSSTRHVTFDVCTGIAGPGNTEPGLLIQPNPAHESVTIGIRGVTSGSALLSISSINGNILFSETIESTSAPVLRKLDLSGYPKGIYFVQLKTGKKLITEKMVVQ